MCELISAKVSYEYLKDKEYGAIIPAYKIVKVPSIVIELSKALQPSVFLSTCLRANILFFTGRFTNYIYREGRNWSGVHADDHTNTCTSSYFMRKKRVSSKHRK